MTEKLNVLQTKLKLQPYAPSRSNNMEATKKRNLATSFQLICVKH